MTQLMSYDITWREIQMNCLWTLDSYDLAVVADGLAGARIGSARPWVGPWDPKESCPLTKSGIEGHTKQRPRKLAPLNRDTF